MQQDAEAHAEEDKKLKEGIETKNHADALAYSTEKALKEHGDKVDEETRTSIEEALATLRKELEGDDLEAIKKAEEDLGTKSQKLGEEVYKQMQAEAESGAAGAADAGPADGGNADNNNATDAEVVDAEVVDDKK